ncbi:MAG: two pore domain potassium channel family protein [Candidatus Diapherotrites archaeon]|uniref:Two pore domain potassium channel family protein n=1 Tax=Candidatus Iainarchaeum sp. TaxID=3101447 RepID=A0A939C4W3_9ARCH|nr:two pore domain potassium channel family protein [Candidatus Diapherotrites archaeon]
MGQTGAKLGFVITVLVLLLAAGTVIYHHLEQWSFVDSFYFTTTTLTTIGYGDLTPTTDLSKVVTVFFALSGVATFLYALSVIAVFSIQKGQSFEEREIRKVKGMLRKLPFGKGQKGQ